MTVSFDLSDEDAVAVLTVVRAARRKRERQSKSLRWESRPENLDEQTACYLRRVERTLEEAIGVAVSVPD